MSTVKWNLKEACMVYVVDRWRERNMWYPGRSVRHVLKEGTIAQNIAEQDILGKILNKDNLNRAYKRVKANKGAPGVDGMTIE